MDEQAVPRSRGGLISPLMVILLISGLLGLIVSIAMLLSAGQETAPQVPASGTALSRALTDWQADNFELASLTGEAIRLSDYEDQVVFLNFWRTDCPPCVRELPAFQQFVGEQGEDGAVVLAINQGEKPIDVESFLDKIGITRVPVLLDEDLRLDNDYPVQNLPTTYIIGRDGYVHYVKIGELTVDAMNRYVDLLDEPAQG